jgi:hypothetical protein
MLLKASTPHDIIDSGMDGWVGGGVGMLRPLVLSLPLLHTISIKTVTIPQQAILIHTFRDNFDYGSG